MGYVSLTLAQKTIICEEHKNRVRIGFKITLISLGDREIQHLKLGRTPSPATLSRALKMADKRPPAKEKFFKTYQKRNKSKKAVEKALFVRIQDCKNLRVSMNGYFIK